MERNSTTETGTAEALKLQYAISSEPFPLLTNDANGAKLKVMVTNNSGAVVKLKGLIMKLPLGTTATDLTSNEIFTPVVPDGWNIFKREVAGGFVKYSFNAKSGNTWSFPDKTAIIFFFNDVKVNAVAGTATIEVTEVSETCTPANNNCPVANLQVSKFPQTWGAVSFKAEPSVIKSLVDKTELSWKGPAGATYTITYTEPGKGVIRLPKAGDPAFSNDGKYPAAGAPDLKLADTTTFTLDVLSTIGGTTYKAQDQKTVTTITEAPRISQFSGSIRRNSAGTMQVVLNWITTGATTHISGDARTHGQNSLGDEYVIDITPQNPLRSSYTLTAINSIGVNEATLKVVWANDVSQSLLMMMGGTYLSKDNSKLFVIGKVLNETTRLGLSKMFVFDPLTLTKIAGSTELDLCNEVPESYMSTAVSPDGTSLYVLITNIQTTTSILKKITVNGNTLTVTSTTNVDGKCSLVVISPDGAKLYVLTTSGVRAYQTSNFSLVNTFSLNDTIGMSLNKNGSLLYLLTASNGKSSLVQVRTSDFGITLGPQEINYGIRIISSPDDKLVCVVNSAERSGTDRFSLYEPREPGRKPAFVYISENQIVEQINIGEALFAPDSQYLFMMGLKKGNSILDVFDSWTQTNAHTSFKPMNEWVFQDLWQPMTLSADGTRLFGFINNDTNMHSFKPVSLNGGISLAGNM